MFFGEVKIKTKKGLRMIQDVEPDEVIVYEGKDCLVTNWEYAGLGELIEVIFDDKYKVKCTPSQKFLVETEAGRVWMEAGELKKKALPDAEGKIHKVINMKEADVDDVFEIQTECGCLVLGNGVIAQC